MTEPVPEPWGIIVTGTLHLHCVDRHRGFGPLCSIRRAEFLDAWHARQAAEATAWNATHRETP